MIPDPVVAVKDWLAADADVVALVGDRVFGGELPESEQSATPDPLIVVREAGGATLGRAWEQYGDVRIDAFAYASTARGASELARAVKARMKGLTRTVVDGVVLHWAMQDGGPIPMADPNTGARFVFSSWQVLVSEVAAA